MNIFKFSRDFIVAWWVFNWTLCAHHKNTRDTTVGKVQHYSKYILLLGLSFVPIAMCGKKAIIFWNVYSWLRYTDDVIDADLPLPAQCSLEQFVQSCDHAVRASGTKISPYLPRRINRALTKSFLYQQKLQCDVQSEFGDIWSVMRWDVCRQGAHVSKDELLENATKQDLAVAVLACKISDIYSSELEEKISNCKGFITRRDWYQDREQDSVRGINNVPKGSTPEEWWDHEKKALGVIRNKEIKELKQYVIDMNIWWSKFVKILVDTH